MTSELLVDTESKTLGKQNFRSTSTGPQIAMCALAALKVILKTRNHL